jgi:signal transduction histidine kinase
MVDSSNPNIKTQEHATLDGYELARVGHIELYSQLIDAIDKGEQSRADQLLKLLESKIHLVQATLDDLVTFHIKAERIAEASRRQTMRENEYKLFGLLISLILLGMAMSRYQILSIARPIAHLRNAATQIGDGRDVNFSAFKGNDEIGNLAHDFERMVNLLHEKRRQSLAELASANAQIEEDRSKLAARVAERTAKLQAANADLESFSYSVSHDLRAPLRAIDGFIEILQEEQAARLDEDGKRMFGIVAENARKMGRLIDDILMFSRAGRLELDVLPVDMHALAKEVWMGLLEGVEGRQIELQLGDIPAVHCDPRAIRQVWQNLLGNAIKFTRDRKPAIIVVSAAEEGDFIRYQVTDNGVGFNVDFANKLFVLFQRLHGMDEFAGTGVGLAIVKRYIQKHGGEVTGVGVKDQGATFSFTLPKLQNLATS